MFFLRLNWSLHPFFLISTDIKMWGERSLPQNKINYAAIMYSTVFFKYAAVINGAYLMYCETWGWLFFLCPRNTKYIITISINGVDDSFSPLIWVLFPFHFQAIILVFIYLLQFRPVCDSRANKLKQRYQEGHPCKDPLGKNQFHTEPIS